MAKRRKALSAGDEVSWRSHGHRVEGSVTRKVDRRTEAAGRKVDASKEEPQYEVRSDKTGKKAVHRPASLKRRKKNGAGS
ncbi:MULTISPECIES: hypervirulence associated TUDOR domain-containing protein [Streptomyces]|uniref:DUF2945 domain-containing protein n=1 Tax=Streptomyces TaxID=1883 RepID=UPI00093DB375|nr:DUF2945 domain-containing protein [Streptomyces sp. CB02130]